MVFIGAVVCNAAAVAGDNLQDLTTYGRPMLEALRKSGYVAARGEATAEEKLRRMLRRFSMEAADAEVLLGMVRKILWKLERE